MSTASAPTVFSATLRSKVPPTGCSSTSSSSSRNASPKSLLTLAVRVPGTRRRPSSCRRCRWIRLLCRATPPSLLTACTTLLRTDSMQASLSTTRVDTADWCRRSAVLSDSDEAGAGYQAVRSPLPARAGVGRGWTADWTDGTKGCQAEQVVDGIPETAVGFSCCRCLTRADNADS